MPKQEKNKNKNTYSSTHPCRKTIRHIPTDTHRHTIVATHTTLLVLCMCHAGGCWSWLTAVRAALVPVSGYFAKRAYYLQRCSPVVGPGMAPGGRVGSVTMRLTLNGGDRYRPPTGILPPSQRPPEGCI